LSSLIVNFDPPQTATPGECNYIIVTYSLAGSEYNLEPSLFDLIVLFNLLQIHIP